MTTSAPRLCWLITDVARTNQPLGLAEAIGRLIQLMITRIFAAAALVLLAGCAAGPIETGPLRVDLRTTPDLVTAEVRNVSGAPVAIVDFEDAVGGAPEQLLIRMRITDGIALQQSREAAYWWNPAIMIPAAPDGPAPTTVIAPGETLVLSANPRDLMLGMTRPPLLRGVEYQVRVVVHAGDQSTVLASQTSAWTTLN